MDFKQNKQNNGIFQVDNSRWGYRIKCKINGEKVDVRKIKDINGNNMTTRQQARAAYAKHMVLLQESNFKSEKNYNMRLRDVWDSYIESNPVGPAKKAPTTLQKQESLWRVHIEKDFGHKYVNSITAEELTSYLETLYEKGYAYSYVESFCKFFWLLFGYAERINALEPDKFLKMFVYKGGKVHMPEKDQEDVIMDKEIEIYDNEQLEQLHTYFKNRNLRIPFLLALYGGLRISEVFGLTWDCYDSKAQTITINKQIAWDAKNHCWYLTKPKTSNSYRTISIPCSLNNILIDEKTRQSKLKKENPILWKSNTSTIIVDRRKNHTNETHTAEEFINLKYDGSLLTNNSVKYDAQNIYEMYGYRLHFHALRRTFITRMAKQGVDKSALMNMTGHSKYETIAGYYEGIEKKDKITLEMALNDFIERSIYV